MAYLPISMTLTASHGALLTCHGDPLMTVITADYGVCKFDTDSESSGFRKLESKLIRPL